MADAKLAEGEKEYQAGRTSLEAILRVARIHRNLGGKQKKEATAACEKAADDALAAAQAGLEKPTPPLKLSLPRSLA